MLTIDGSQGEGGGQILRTSLALSAITGTPVRIERIRAGRPKPGLQRQHLVAVQAVAQVSGARVQGAELGSTGLAFAPGVAKAGDWRFDIGSAGSTTLVLQTVLPVLLHADGPSTVSIRGGTHNGMSPPVDFIADSFLPAIRRIGIGAEVALTRHGFYPAGGGELQATVAPWRDRVPLSLCERGARLEHGAEILAANLPANVSWREAQAVMRDLGWDRGAVVERPVPADGPGNAIVARVRHAEVTAVFSTVGERRTAAEDVARDCCEQVRRYLGSDAPVCEHLADQLLLPLALGAGGRFRTVAPSAHTLTNAAVIARFLGDAVSIAREGEAWSVTVRARSTAA